MRFTAAALSALLVVSCAAAPKPAREPREVIVATRNVEGIRGAIDALGTITDRSENGRKLLLRLRDNVRLMDALIRLTQEQDVVYAEPNYATRSAAQPNDPNFGQQWPLTKTQTDLAWEIWRPVASTNIAIVDTGIDTTRPELVNKILRDSTGAVVGFDAYSNHQGDPGASADHGTQCAEVAAAQINDSVTIAGVAGWNGDLAVSDTTWTKLIPVRAQAGEDEGDVFHDARAMNWASSHAAGVMSMSWNATVHPSFFQQIGMSAWGPDFSDINDAVVRALDADVAMVAAAGNDGSTHTRVPADRHGVLSVAASDSNDVLFSYSNYGSWVDVAAPGTNLTVLTGTPVPFGGTSSATPFVAGEAALVRSQNPSLNETYVRTIIKAAHDPIAGAHTIASEGGRVNVRRALEAAGKPTIKLTITPDTTNGGAPMPMAYVTLLTPPVPAPTILTVSTLDPDVIGVPPTAFVPANASSTSFPITVKQIPHWPKTTIIVNGPDGGRAAGSLWVYSLLHGLEQFLADPQTVRQGKEIAMRTYVDRIHRTDEPIDLTSTDPAIIAVPAQVWIGANQLARNLYVRAGAVTAPTNVTITARIGQSVKSVTVHVIP